jgi:CRISPR-associated protein (TIGR03986 family)
MVIDRQKGAVTIEDHGIPGRISAHEIDTMLNLYGTESLESFITGDNLVTEKSRTAKHKYEKIIKGRTLRGKFNKLPKKNTVDPRLIVKVSNEGEAGIVVLTGQPGKRSFTYAKDGKKKGKGKFYEFVFFDNVFDHYTLDMNEENGVFEDFCFIYNDSDDWKYWKKKDRIPVFFTVENGTIQYMGLSYLFKLPFKKHINEYLNTNHRDSRLDLAECIFGTTDGDSLKGRVQFSHAFCVNPQVGDTIEPYMGSPKPTYYPIYTQQKGTDGIVNKVKRGNKMVPKYKTFLDEDAKLRGWKRYPVRQTTSNVTDPIKGQENKTSPFRPLNEGSEFIFSIRYHNLREVELAALVYALNINDRCFYSLGFCKPFGYGLVKVEIIDMDTEERKRQRKVFTDLMETKINGYQNTPQIKELKAMMTLDGGKPIEPLQYIPDPKSFADLKKEGEYQRNYSDLLPSIGKKAAPSVEKTLFARVSFIGHGMITAKLDSGQSYRLDLQGRKEKLRIGDKVQVRMLGKGANQILLFIKKVY